MNQLAAVTGRHEPHEWSVRWVETRSGFQAREVFTHLPTGVEYIRTPTRELAEVVVTDWSTPLPALYLKRRDSSTKHLRKGNA